MTGMVWLDITYVYKHGSYCNSSGKYGKYVFHLIYHEHLPLYNLFCETKTRMKSVTHNLTGEQNIWNQWSQRHRGPGLIHGT